MAILSKNPRLERYSTLINFKRYLSPLSITKEDGRLIFYSLAFLVAGTLLGIEMASRRYCREFDSQIGQIQAYKNTLEMQAYMIWNQERKIKRLEWKIEDIQSQSPDKDKDKLKKKFEGY
ncbi:MAG: hypothetical protein WCK90_03835 [archaeon]